MKLENIPFNPEKSAFEAAHAANEAFDRASAAKMAIAAAQSELATANSDFSAADAMAGAYFDPGRKVEQTEPIDNPEVAMESASGVELSIVWSELTPERQKEASRRAEALAEMPIFKEKGIKPEDFRVVNFGQPDNPRYSVSYAKTKRLDLGDPTKTYDAKRSWSSIKPGEPNAAFMLELDGQTIDVRATQKYDRLAAVSRENSEIKEWVLETGKPERAVGDVVPAVSLIDGQAFANVLDRGDDIADLGFRPAADLP